MKSDVHVFFCVGVLGHALVDVQFGLVDRVNFIDETVDPVALGFDNIGVATLVDLPSVVSQSGSADVLAVGTSPLHLLEMKVATIGKVEHGRPVTSPLLSGCMGCHNDEE